MEWLRKIGPDGCNRTNGLGSIKLERKAARGNVDNTCHFEYRFESNALLAHISGRTASLGAFANLTDCSNIAFREARLIAINPETTSFVGKLKSRICAIVRIVVGVLNQFVKEVRFTGVELAG